MKGFTLVEIIATIAILSIIILISVPSVLKSFNKSRIQAMAIQENKLVEAGDILLDDYCKDALDDEKKRRCKFYYQDLALSDAEKLNYSEIVKDDKKYKYICVSDIKDLHYYSEELVYSGTPCQGVVIYEIDKKSNLTSDSYSYVKCEDAYRTEEKNVKIEELFKGCFDGSNATNREQTYTVTVKHVENDLGGMEISPRKTHTVKESELLDGDDDVLFEIETIIHTRNGNTYKPVLKMSGENIKFNEKKVNNKAVYEITGLPSKNLTINIVYTVEKHAIVSNFYRFVPGKDENEKSHDGVKMTGIEEQSIIGYTFETMKVDIPETLDQTIGGKTEKYSLVEVWVEDSKKTLPFDGKVEVGQEDRNVDLIYQQEEFNVTYNNKGGSGCDTGRIKYNKKYKESTYCTPTKTAYTFLGWSLTDGGEVLDKEEKNLDYHDITLYAKYEPKTYIITYHIGNASSTVGATAVATSSCKYNETCVLTDFSTFKTPFPYSYEDEQATLNTTKHGNYGWSFAGWTTDKDTTPNASNQFNIDYTNNKSFVYNMDNNLNLYAIGKRNLHINGGIAPTKSYSEPIQYWNPYGTSDTYVTEVSLPNEQNISGWTFLGYKCGDSTANSSVTLSSSLAGTKYKVPYNKYPYTRSVYQRTLTVAYNANTGSGTTSSQTGTQYYNSGFGSGGTNNGSNVSQVDFSLRANAFTKTGYSFSKWAEDSVSGTKYSSGSTYTMKPSVNSTATTKTMYAIWTSNSYTVTFNANGGSTPSPTSKTVTNGQTYGTLATTSRAGYTFDGWYTSASGGTKVTSSSIVSITSNQTLYAHWTANTYTVTFNANGGTTPSPTSKSVTYDQTYGTLATTSRTGYTFAGWYTSASGGTKVTSSSTVSITANQTLYAHWTSNSYTVTFNANGGTTPSPTSKSVTNGQTYGTLATTSRAGYTFAGWYTSASGGTKITASSTVSITANQTLYAHWTSNTYTVTFNANGGTTPSPATKSVTYAQTYGTLATTSRTGYTFAGWYTSASGGTKITASSTVSITANQTLYAHWTSNSYTVTFNANGGTTPSPTSKTVTNAQTYGTLATTSRTGYTFAGWYTSASGGTKITASSTVSITANQTLYAKWSKNTYTITYNLNGGTQGASPKTSYDVETITFNLPTPTKTGYSFGGWYTSADFSGSKVTSISKGSTGNKTFYAKWNENYIEVTYHPNGANDIRFKGTSMSDSQFMSTTKEKIYYDTYKEYGLPDIKNNDWFYLTRNGYRSTGKWYSGSYTLDQSTAITGKTLAEYFGLDISKESKNLDIYAQWQQCSENTYSNIGNNSCDACTNGYYSSAGATKCNPIEYTIAYHLNGGTQGTNPKTSYNIETNTFNLPTPTRTNYIFAGWYTTSNFSGSKVTSISKGSTGNKTFYAKWILYIYNEGTTNTAVTGGWDTRGLDHYPAVSYNAEVKPIVTYNSTYISINQNNYANGNSGFLYTKNKINLSEFKKLYMVVDYDIGNYNYGFGAIDALNATTWQDDTAVEYEFPRESSGGKITKVIDISGVTGNWNVHIGCVSYTGTSKFNVYKMWLEP